MAYDDDNVFARILRGEIGTEKVYEDEHVLAFNDIAHVTPVHVLVIPKGRYATLSEFSAKASDAEMAAIFRAIGVIARETGIEADGYRVVANCGAHGGQALVFDSTLISSSRTRCGIRAATRSINGILKLSPGDAVR